MKKVTRKFVEIAYKAMQEAYNHEADKNNGVGEFYGEFETEEANKVGDVLQAVGNLMRMS